MKESSVITVSYDPIALSARMSDYGYWVVTVSVAPGLRMSVMICRIGITQQEAIESALATTLASRVTKE